VFQNAKKTVKKEYCVFSFYFVFITQYFLWNSASLNTKKHFRYLVSLQSSLIFFFLQKNQNMFLI